jgi:predicted RNase H-like HicB family nuclease
MNYNLKIHSEDNRYWAECIELKGCNTQGDSLEELIKIRKQPYTTSSIRFSSLLS